MLAERLLERVELAVRREPLDRRDLAPSAWTASIVQLLTALPSTRTVHAPHWLVSQPTWVPVSPRSSRRNWTSSVGARPRPLVAVR